MPKARELDLPLIRQNLLYSVNIHVDKSYTVKNIIIDKFSDDLKQNRKYAQGRQSTNNNYNKIRKII